MVRLRELCICDIDYMYEFIEDSSITSNFVFTRYPISKEKLIDFIRTSWTDTKNVHFAIVGETDEYFGTISLKNIDYINRNAEYAIIIRKKFWGKNFAFEATQNIIEYGFNRLNLRKIYLNVLSCNVRANKFYEKFGFIREGIFKEHLYIDGRYEDLIWYSIFKTESVSN